MRIYVGNISFTTEEGSLAAMFSQHGEVSDTVIITDRETGRSRGFGFVEMPNDDEAREAIEQLNGATLDNRPLSVREAMPRNEGGRGGGGGGGGGRGGYGGGRGGGGGGRGGGRGGDRGSRGGWG
jgi:RNA recognition motif-containing protein